MNNSPTHIHFINYTTQLNSMLQSPFTYTSRKRRHSNVSSYPTVTTTSTTATTFTSTSTSTSTSTCTSTTHSSLNTNLPTPTSATAPIPSPKRQRKSKAAMSVLINKLSQMQSKIDLLQECGLKCELQQLIEESVQELNQEPKSIHMNIPQKSFNEFILNTPKSSTPLTLSTQSTLIKSCREEVFHTIDDEEHNNLIENYQIFETPKEKIINYDKITTPPRAPRQESLLPGLNFPIFDKDEIESAGLGF